MAGQRRRSRHGAGQLRQCGWKRAAQASRQERSPKPTKGAGKLKPAPFSLRERSGPPHALQGRHPMLRRAVPHHVTRPLRMRDSFARGKGIRITQSEGPRPPAASPPAASRLDGWAPALLGRSGWPPQQRYAARKSRRSSHLPGRTPRASRSRRSPRSRQPRYRKPSSCRSSCPSTRTRWVPRSR